jgi:hypothetical protein
MALDVVGAALEELTKEIGAAVRELGRFASGVMTGGIGGFTRRWPRGAGWVRRAANQSHGKQRSNRAAGLAEAGAEERQLNASSCVLAASPMRETDRPVVRPNHAESWLLPGKAAVVADISARLLMTLSYRRNSPNIMEYGPQPLRVVIATVLDEFAPTKTHQLPP